MTINNNKWTPDMLAEHVTTLFAAADIRYKERFESGEKNTQLLINANDSRYQSRFLAQEQAVKDALISQEKAINAALTSSDKAIQVAEINSEKWRANADEWRGAMTDREKQFATQNDYKLLKERLDRTEGSTTGHREMWGWISAGIVLIITIITTVIVPIFAPNTTTTEMLTEHKELIQEIKNMKDMIINHGSTSNK